MPEPSTPSIGLAVTHLFWRVGADVDAAAVAAAVDAATAAGDQVVTSVILGHKADLATMALGPDQWRLRRFQTAMSAAGLTLVSSYVSLTELSEYNPDPPEQLREARLNPQLPPAGKPVFCFYPMSKRRNIDQNWYELDFERRKELMYEHGMSGRKFSGRVLQVVTGSTGLDEYEWGVTLFAERPDDVKSVVYTLRFDEASARYAEFGPFYVGMITDIATALDELGVG